MALHVAPPPPPCSQRTHPASQKTTTSVAGVEQDPTFPQRRRCPPTPPPPSERPGGHTARKHLTSTATVSMATRDGFFLHTPSCALCELKKKKKNVSAVAQKN